MTYSLATHWRVDNPDDALDCTPDQVRERIRVYRQAPPAYGQDILEQYVTEGLRVARLARARASLGFSQSLHETAGLRFGGQVKPHQLNFGGLGATNDGAQGASFQTVRDGWMAFWAHHMSYWWGAFSNWPDWAEMFKQYAYRNKAVLDAGYGGVVTTVGDYTNGRWAWSPQYPRGSLQNGYAQAIVNGANAIRALPRGEPPVGAQIPGFAWQPASTSHYERGRTQRIRGGAQHYTAGTNSLNWLTRTSNPPVSATFLVKHNPTLEDRGWQLVRIEDTAWTTAFANPYTVSIEYEHTGRGAIPPVAYTVMAQTWIDIAAYVQRHNLGEIPLDRTGIRGHREWVNNPALICPDGIELDRIVAEIKRLQGTGRDPDALYIAGNPFGEIPVVLGFRQYFLDMGAARFPDDPIAGGLSLFGYPIGPEYPTADGGSAQEFERAILKYDPGKAAPWDVVIALRSEGLPERRAA